MLLKKIIGCAFLLICISTLHAQKNADPDWYNMMHDPKVNFHKAVKAHETYWKNKKLKPIKELRELESDEHKHLHKGMSQTELVEYKRILLLNRDFENWVQEESSWVQPDGRILSQAEKMAIIQKQQNELKEIEIKNGKNW